MPNVEVRLRSAQVELSQSGSAIDRTERQLKLKDCR